MKVEPKEEPQKFDIKMSVIRGREGGVSSNRNNLNFNLREMLVGTNIFERRFPITWNSKRSVGWMI